MKIYMMNYDLYDFQWSDFYLSQKFQLLTFLFQLLTYEGRETEHPQSRAVSP